MLPRTLSLLSLLALLSTGCVSVGPKTIPHARYDYNEAMTRSFKEQLLLNLVRLRYRDVPLFLEVGSIVAQYELSGSLSADSDLEGGGSLGAGFDVSETPTITYLPLSGEEFARRLLTPMSPATLVRLSQSGWSIERILLCCVHQVGPLRNAPSAAGPTPTRAPDFERFHELAAALRELQAAGLLEAELVAPPEPAGGKEGGEKGTETPSSILLYLYPDRPACRPGAEGPAAGRELPDAWLRAADLLGLPADRRREGAVLLTTRGTGDTGCPAVPQAPISGRSLLATLFYLSQAVETPAEHRERAWVTDTLDAAGEPFDWSRMTGRLLRIGTSGERPQHPYAAVRYRGRWFYVDESWADSKSTFILLTYLFALQDTGDAGQGPLLTITSGG